MRDDIDRLYVSRKEGGGGWDVANIEDSIDASIWGFENYIKKSKERRVTATRNSIDNKDKHN